MGSGRIAALLLLCALMLNGCGTGPNQPAGPLRAPTPAQVHPRWDSCADLMATGDLWTDPRPPGPGSVPTDFTPTEALVCHSETRTQADGSEAEVLLEGRSTRIADLLQALQRPGESADPSEDVACTADAWLPPWLFLSDAEHRWIYPQIPTTVCSKPFEDFSQAYERLPLEFEQQRVLRVLTGADAAKAHCDQFRTDMVAYAAAYGASGDPARGPADDRPLRRCLYRVPPQEAGQDKAQGVFTTGGPMGVQARRRVIAAAEASTAPAAQCSERSSTFAYLVGDPDGPEIYVELDGCRRMLRTSHGQPGPLHAADRALIELLR